MRISKAVLAFALLVLGASGAVAALPIFITYQGIYFNAGVPSTGTVSMEFRVTDGNAVPCNTAGGANHIAWTSGVQSVATSTGVFSYKIGLKPDQVAQDPAFLSNMPFSKGNFPDTPPFYIDVCAGGVSLTPHDLIGWNGYSLYASSASALNVTTQGSVLIADGNQAAGNVLTSDANGNAKWQAPVPGGFSNFQTYSTHGTYALPIPAGSTKIMIELWGAGGAGGGAGGQGTGGGGFGGQGGGGGGGTYAKFFFNTANGANFTPGTNLTVTVGATGVGGTGGAVGASGTAGSNGGNSSVQNSGGATIAIAGGGGGGSGGGPGVAAPVPGGTSGTGTQGPGGQPVNACSGPGNVCGSSLVYTVQGNAGGSYVAGCCVLGGAAGGGSTTQSSGAGGPGGVASNLGGAGGAGSAGLDGMVIVWY